MDMCEENHQIGMWEDSFKADSSQNTCASTVMEADMRIDYLVDIYSISISYNFNLY